MLKRLTLFVAAAALTAASVASAAEPVKIGFSIANTGLFAQAAPSQMNAYQLWAEQVNERGGLDVAGERRPVELVWYDDESDPNQSAQIYERLINDDNVDLLLAPWGTPHHLNVAGVVERYGFPMVGNTASSVAIREIRPGNIWFSTSAVPDRIGPDLAKMLADAGVRSVAVIANVLPFSQENHQFLIPALKENGIEVVIDESYPPDIRDMTSMLTQVRNANVDALIALTYPADAFLLTGQAKELGIDVDYHFQLIGPTISAYKDAFGEDANGIITLAHWSPEQADWPRARPFYDAYVAKFGSAPDYLDSALAYMSCEILEQAVAEAGLDRDRLREVIASTTFETINGPVRFDGVQNAVTPNAFLQHQGSEIHLVWPDSVATAPLKTR